MSDKVKPLGWLSGGNWVGLASPKLYVKHLELADGSMHLVGGMQTSHFH